MHRRQLMFTALGTIALAASAGFVPAHAQDKSVTIGIELPLTGADADSATRIRNGAIMAIDDANAKGGVGGYKLNVTVLDSGTSTAGQYDPAGRHEREEARRRSRCGRHRRPRDERRGQGDDADPVGRQSRHGHASPDQSDITDPKFAAQYKPGGKAIYFRTVDGRLSGPEHGQLHARHL
jgi:branched-chain amino acid transport system substrate-binding protein